MVQKMIGNSCLYAVLDQKEVEQQNHFYLELPSKLQESLYVQDCLSFKKQSELLC